MEFMYKLSYHYYDLSWHDFQIDHSKAYVIAMCVCLTEYWLKRYFGTEYFLVEMVSESQVSKGLTALGIMLVVIGHYFRIHSMFHAKANFNHLVQS